MRDIALPVVAAALSMGMIPLGAQVTPPTPPPPPAPAVTPRTPRVPRPSPAPRPPRAPRAWFGSLDTGLAKIDTVVPLSANGTVELSLVAGAMKVSTWDRNQVRVVASATGVPSLQFDASSSHVTLEQVKTSWRGNQGGDGIGRATYDVTVPASARASLSAVSGDINASGMRGRLEVSNVSGSVDVRDVGASLSAEGVSSRITVVNVAGDVRIENVSGRISVSGAGGSVNVETVSGPIALSGVRGERVHATSVSGGIDFAGPVTSSGRYEFETHSGRTELRLASNANAAISVETFSGSVSNDYPGAVRRRNSDPDDDRTNFDYVIGRGEGRIRAETFSGSVHISQGQP
jgi:hypothetical protein